LVLAEHGRDLHVRFAIEEGAPTLLTHISVDIQAEPAKQEELCTTVLKALSGALDAPELATRDPKMKEPCAATATTLRYRSDDVAATTEKLRDLLYQTGRPRAQVELETVPNGPDRMSAHYKLRRLDEVRVGKIVIRGNFKTRESVIREQLGLREGTPLTRSARDEGIANVRRTGLFDAVNIEFPDLCGVDATSRTCASGSAVVNGVLRVEERFDHRAELELVAGGSTYQGLFGGATLAMRNIAGLGLVWTINATVGTKITELESQFQIPEWLAPLPFRTELTGLYRQQDTPRFGVLTTEGASVSLAHQFQRSHSASEDARVITWNILRYDFRLRTREVDAIRTIGANQDSAQVAVSTRTSSLGMAVVWDQRVDRNGQLSPLAPEGGFLAEAAISYAESAVIGQDTFVKLAASGSKFWTIRENLLLRWDLRIDWGIPLGGAVLLPEVERFFAGGDSTVRGYSDDRMATELIQVGVPPIGSNLTQIRIIPAGGNIRGLGSLDGQMKIYPIPGGFLAGALFSDLGMITNTWASTKLEDFRPSVGMGLRVLTPFGVGAIEYAVPLRPQLGDDPRGRIHFYFAARAQF
ncbi:MAG: BamA/TamA family outer membrane protein, partial [Kofleriaceae bacterium]